MTKTGTEKEEDASFVYCPYRAWLSPSSNPMADVMGYLLSPLRGWARGRVRVKTAAHALRLVPLRGTQPRSEEAH